MNNSTHAGPIDTQLDATARVLLLAKKLHREATSDSLAASLPILRRLIASKTLHSLSLSQLRQRRSMVQRKHILRMLAIEAGHAGWEDYRRSLAHMTCAQLKHFDVVRPGASYPNPWFASHAEAERYAATHGGQVIAVGGQAVVLQGREGAAHE